MLKNASEVNEGQGVVQIFYFLWIQKAYLIHISTHPYFC